MPATAVIYPPLFHERLFDRVEAFWHSAGVRRFLAWMLVLALFVSITSIELARQKVISSFLGFPLPTNHLGAISWVVTLLLMTETLDLIFALAKSVADSLGKQLEVFSLILIRKAFDELPGLPEPVTIAGGQDVVLRMASLAGAAVLVFLGLILYYRLQRHAPISRDQRDLARFVALKKLTCLGLLTAFIATAATTGLQTVTIRDPGSRLSLDFFRVFFTVLIFADILVVLASLSVTRAYNVVFRNFAFTVVTIFIRLAVTAKPYEEAILAVIATVLSLATAYLYDLSQHHPALTEPPLREKQAVPGA